MNKAILSIFTLIILGSCNDSKADVKESSKENIQNTETNEVAAVENYLNTPEQIKLNGTDFTLSWSSHPSANYCKQEYIPQNNELEAYKEMISVELVTGPLTAKDAVDQKIQEIEARKATDRVSNYALKEDKETKELILDFMMSEGSGESTILEWNVYRYTNFEDASGQKGISLFSLSKRGYGGEIAQFGPNIRDNRPKYMAEFIALPRPTIRLNKN
ncbi:hypothetical protein [Kaistella carnis]|uniref:hypothetical protein n=1 Tax=Kaistella carnis TaxID=1241979 RepID=UPI00289B5B25|nr:hypothetical protein [Kaistella carnis]